VTSKTGKKKSNQTLRRNGSKIAQSSKIPPNLGRTLKKASEQASNADKSHEGSSFEVLESFGHLW